MSFNTFGKLFRFSTWGESHGPAIGCIIDGCPPNINLKEQDIQVELDKKDSLSVDIEETPTAMDAYDITVDNESHTLGFVIQEHANKLIDDNELVYVGYMNPHPLKKNIKIRVALNNNNVDNVVKQLKFVCKNIINQCNSIKAGIEKKFGKIGMEGARKQPVAEPVQAAEVPAENQEVPSEEETMEGGNLTEEEEYTDYGEDDDDEEDEF